MKIIVNGKQQVIAPKTTLECFLTQNAYPTRRIAVEYNGQIITRDEYARLFLKEGDKLEIVRFVGGG